MNELSQLLTSSFTLTEEDPNFEVIHVGIMNATRPLIVWVHPGDVCENDNPSRCVQLASLKLQDLMGEEVTSRLGDSDVVILHRQSSEYAFQYPGKVSDSYLYALDDAHNLPSTTLLYGDDLDKASAWLLEHASVATRPCIWLTGAYSHADHGCVAEVGKALMAAGSRVEISPNSPSEAGSVKGAWKPHSRKRPTFP